jgi:hypothetical protein
MTKEDTHIIHHHNKYYTKLIFYKLIEDQEYYLGDYCNPDGNIALRGFYIKHNNEYILHGNTIEYTFGGEILSYSKYEYGIKVSGKEYYYTLPNKLKYEGNYHNEKMHGLGKLYNREGDNIEINFNMNIPHGIGIYYNSKTKKEYNIKVNNEEWYNIIHKLEWHELFCSKTLLI